jgi:hypothetical protein
MTELEACFEKRMKMAEEIGSLKMSLQKVTEAALSLMAIHIVRGPDHGGNPSPGQWAEFESEIRAFGKIDLIDECCL